VWSEFLGKEYRDGGRGPNAYDCYGLVMAVAAKVGVYVPDLQTPGSLADTHQLYMQERELCLKLEKPKPFCIVAFIIRSPYVTHMGMVLPDTRRFIHIMYKRLVTIERLVHPVWQKRVAGYYEFINSKD